MINHIVLFKLKDYPVNEKSTILAEMKSLLEGLNNKIEVLRHIEVGLNYELDAKSFDLALITHFNNLDELEAYRIHPEHQKVLNRFAEFNLDRAAVDFHF
jgi:hypothetical protein